MSNDTVDYEKQYQEDLERAQALSLESLALEQFKNRRRLQTLNISSNSEPLRPPRSTSVSRASSLNESDSSSISLQPKSRPRPGVLAGGQLRSLIAPPPVPARRNSSASNDSNAPDLISFTSPPENNTTGFYPFNINQKTPSTAIDNILNLNRPQTLHQNQNQNQAFVGANVNAYLHSPFTPVQNHQWPSSSILNKNIMVGLQRNVSQDLSTKIINTSRATQNNLNLQQTPNSLPILPNFVSSSNSNSNTKNFLRSSPSSSSLKTPNTPSNEQVNNNLIDLAPSSLDDKNSVRVSILEEFDPIMSSSSSSLRTISPEYHDDSASVCDSVYDEYDPYDFIYTGSGNNSVSDPIYAAVVKSENAPSSPPPPLPPPIHHSTLERRKTNLDILAENKLHILDYISKTDRNRASHDADLKAFYKMVLKVRSKFHYRHPDTNMGLVISPMVRYKYAEGTSIKLCVHPDYEGAEFNKPVFFTCDVTSSVEHVTLQLTCDLDAPAKDKYTLKVWGYNEYLVPTTLLSDYEYVHNCIKLEEDIKLILIPDSKVDRCFARTLQDDNRDKEIKFEDVIPNEPVSHISYEHIKILLETFENEVTKLETAAKQIDDNINPSHMPALQPSAVIQSVKLLAKLMGTIVTLEITEAVDALDAVCKDFVYSQRDISFYRSIKSRCNNIRLAIQGLIEMYSQAFRVDFQIRSPLPSSELPTRSSDILDSVLVRVCALHRPLPEWKHDSYIIAAQIYHGTRPVGPVLHKISTVSDYWYPRISFNDWFNIDGVTISSLAREARLVFVLYGRTLQTQEGGDNSDAAQYKEEELGFAAIQFFNYEGMMVQGGVLLSIWPKESNYLYGPAPAPGTHPHPEHPVLSIEIPVMNNAVFPPVPANLISNVIKGDFSSLDLQTQQQLLDISEQDMLYKIPPQLREVLWEKRHYLYNIPESLPKVLLAAHSWEWASLPDLHGMLRCWKPMEPTQALQLLLPTFPDMEVRRLAVKWIGGLTSDELVDYLPQLVVALRIETYEDSPLAEFLLDQSLRSPRVAHHLFWLLSHSLPGSTPQNYFEVIEKDNVTISETRHHRRITLLLRALLAICGESLRKCFISQQLLVKELNRIAENVQKTKESQRIHVLYNGLESIHHMLLDGPVSLPLSPTLRVTGIHVKSCSYFPSNTLPLKINFLAYDGSVIPAIYKVGDDLQQDMLTLQMVRIMDKLWLHQGLDLKIVTFSCVPTGKRKGMIELVNKAETLRKIQVEHGLTGSFKDKPIAEWLAKHNPSELEYGRAVENFTASCAGYCVVTYILGICDRHNDNIMLKTSGHLFHIDFGKFLGDAQMFGNFKRDRTPFVLTSDMAYVINGGDRPSEKFHKFVDLCCQAFNIIRNNGNLFVYLFTLMASSGIKGVTTEAVTNLHKALLPQLSNAEAAAYFARLIESSLKSWFTQFNFFLHNLAQLKFTGDHGDGELLSFVPKTYSMQTDGRLVHVEVVGYQKRYDPDKYYVYILRLHRQGQNHSMEILRTYKEFCELHQKLCLHFPLAKLHSLSSGLHMGRSNIKQVAHKRYQDISLFITSLFRTADEIAHSDLVYTFFHPLLRDQQIEDFTKKNKVRRIEDKNEVGRLKGQLKLSIQFTKNIFGVMVHHARGLPLVGNAQEPSTYVKVYLEPDPSKTTKRKTKIVKRNCHPSFMEMLEYRMPLDIVKGRILKATVWNHDPLQENEFLGGVELELGRFDLTKEITEWFPLTNLSR